MTVVPSSPGAWIVSREFDLAFFVAPALVPAAAAVLLPAGTFGVGHLPVWAWIVFVMLVDVAHVWASIYRTYLDREELARRPLLYTLTPIACLTCGVLLYRLGGALPFWRVLAYLAVFHFVRQQYGFLALYDHRAGRLDQFDRRLNALAIYGATAGPLLYWHTHLPRQFDWFVPGDFLPLEVPWLWPVAAVGLTALYAGFIARQLWLWRNRRRGSWGRVAIVASTLAAWSSGIVLFDSDFVFTMTNTVAHGVPYFALVWLTVRRQRGNRPGARRSFLATVTEPEALPVFLGILFGLAYFEEGLWDILVWREHGSVFGTRGALVESSTGWLWFLVPLLTVPQATHYVLDAFIWKLDGSNPGLREALLEPASPGAA